ncbi:hypothetical protein HN937_06510 [Candidatus Poribacteria bacterium]|nr:hypothetical protein [Candidatus Poribacteria bacterium]
MAGRAAGQIGRPPALPVVRLCDGSGTTLSAADALFVLAQYADFMLRERRRPTQVQIRRTLGPVEEVLAPSGPLVLPRASLLATARQIVHHIDARGYVPHAVRAHRVDCGPGEVLLALAQAIAADRLPDQVTVEPTGGVPKCAGMGCFANPGAGSALAQPPDYDPSRIRMQARQQSWSYRPAVAAAE